MSLTEAVVNTGIPSFLDGIETYDDKRKKLILLYRDGNATIDVLVTDPTPIEATQGQAIRYFSFRDHGQVLSHFWNDAALFEHRTRRGDLYMTLLDGKREIVLPYAAREFPSKIANTSFTNFMVECEANSNRDIMHYLAALFLHTEEGRQYAHDNPSIVSDHPAFFGAPPKITNNDPKSLALFPLRKSVLAAFSGYPSSSTSLPFFRRNMAHYLCHDVNIYFTQETGTRKLLSNMSAYFRDIGRHFYYTTEQNRLFMYHSIQRAIELVHSISPITYEAILRTNKKEANEAAGDYHWMLLMSSLGSHAAGHNPLAISLLGLCLAEIISSKISRAKSGYSTSLVGMLREKRRK